MSAKTTRFGIPQQLIKSLKIQLLAVALVTFLPSSIFAQVAKSAEGKKAEQKPVESAEVDPHQLPDKPGNFMGRAIAPVMSYLGADWLLRDTREQEEQPEQMIDALNLKAGDVVADVGAGVGDGVGDGGAGEGDLGRGLDEAGAAEIDGAAGVCRGEERGHDL